MTFNEPKLFTLNFTIEKKAISVNQSSPKWISNWEINFRQTPVNRDAYVCLCVQLNLIWNKKNLCEENQYSTRVFCYFIAFFIVFKYEYGVLIFGSLQISDDCLFIGTFFRLLFWSITIWCPCTFGLFQCGNKLTTTIKTKRKRKCWHNKLYTRRKSNVWK